MAVPGGQRASSELSHHLQLIGARVTQDSYQKLRCQAFLIEQQLPRGAPFVLLSGSRARRRREGCSDNAAPHGTAAPGGVRGTAPALRLRSCPGSPCAAPAALCEAVREAVRPVGAAAGEGLTELPLGADGSVSS